MSEPSGDCPLTPIDDSLVVDFDSEAQRTQQGLYVPNSEVYAARAEVIAVGPGAPKRDGETPSPLPFEPGEYVLFTPNSGLKVLWRGQEYYLLRRHHVICKVSADEAKAAKADPAHRELPKKATPKVATP